MLPLLVSRLLGLLFEPENGDSALLRNVGNFYPSTCRYIPGDNAVHSHCRENSKSNMVEKFTGVGHNVFADVLQ